MAISEAIAGAVSTIVDGEFVATTKSQNEVLRGEIALETRGETYSNQSP